MELDCLKYLPMLTPDKCSGAPVYEMARIMLKPLINQETLYADVFQVLGRGEVLAGIVQQYKVADVLYIRRVNLGVDELGNFVSSQAPIETRHRIQLEDIVEYVVLQPKL